MGKAVTSEQIKVRGARLAFANFDKPEYFKKGQPKENEVPMYRGTLLLDPSNSEHAEIIAKVRSEAKRIAEAKAAQDWDGKIPKNLDKCYGLDEDLPGKIYDGFKDMFFIRVASKDPFPIVGRQRTGPVDPTTGKRKFESIAPGHAEWPYNGCYVNATISLWTQDSHGRKGINGNLLAVQYMKPGKEFGRASADADKEFDEVEAPVETGEEEELF